MNIQQFWKDVLRQDAEAMRTWFHADAYVRWHCSNEEFTVEEFIRANCEYPGDWDGEIERVDVAGDVIICAVQVYPKDRSAGYHVASFVRVRDGKIAGMDEYWSDDMPAPEWRQAMKIGRPIRK